MKTFLIIWLVGTLLFFLLTSTHPAYKERIDDHPFFVGCFTLVYSLAWPILVPYLIYITLRNMRNGKEQ